jgi:glycosyltransferase involved in cell wall biosynthesis
VIANGVAVPREALRPSEDAVAHIVCVANYERRKGLHDLIRAAASLPASGRTWRISFLGAESDPAYKHSLQQLAEVLGVDGRISLPGPASAGQVAECLRSAYLFCLPSHDEGLPMSMLEAMAHAVPVVATRVGAIPEAVDEGVEALLYPAKDVPALAAALARLLESPELARRMGENGRRRLALNYSLEAMSRQVFGVYRQLLAGGLCPRPVTG